MSKPFEPNSVGKSPAYPSMNQTQFTQTESGRNGTPLGALQQFLQQLFDKKGDAQQSQVLKVNTEGITQTRVYPDGSKLLTVGRDKKLTVWDNTAQKSLFAFTLFSDQIAYVGFIPSKPVIFASFLATSTIGAGSGTIHLWHSETGQTLVHLDNTYPPLAYCKDGSMIAYGSSNRLVMLMDTMTGRQIRGLVGIKNHIEDLMFTPDGQQVIACSSTGELMMWRVETGELSGQFYGHTGSISDIALSPNGQRLASVSLDGTLRLWELNGRQISFVQTGVVSGDPKVRFSKDSQMLFATYGNAIHRWRSDTGTAISVFKFPSNKVSAYDISLDGKYAVLAETDKPEFGLYHLETGQCLQTFKGHSWTVYSLRFSDDMQRVYSGSGDGTVRQWALNLQTNQPVAFRSYR